jgi:uncharacterized membrane protein HdeD (DUF308 family)
MTAMEQAPSQGNFTLGRVFLVVWGVLLLIAGLFIVTNPAVSALTWVLIMAIAWFIGGIFDTIGAITQRTQGWVWRLIGGIIGIVAGLYIIANPILGTLFVIEIAFLLIAISAIFDGAVNIFTGLRTSDGRLASLLLGIIQIVAGVWLLLHPIAGMIALVYVFGFFVIAAGVVTIILAIRG